MSLVLAYLAKIDDYFILFFINNKNIVVGAAFDNNIVVNIHFLFLL